LGEGSVLVRSESEELLKPLRSYLRHHLSAVDSPRAEVDLRLKKVITPIPSHAPLALRYFGLKVFFLEGRTYFTDFRSYLTLEPDGKRAIGFISPETLVESGVYFFTHIFFCLALFEILRHQGFFFLHSAGLVSPAGKSYIFPASSGQGKSTLSVYLIRQGYKYLSDDTVFLARNAHGVKSLAFEKVSHLPEHLIKRFDELRSFKNAPRLEPRGKKLVELERIYPALKAKEADASGAVIFLNKVDNGRSRLKPLSRAEAIYLLLCQNPFASVNPALAREHLDTFRDLLCANRVWVMDSGSDWISNPSILTRLLESAIKERKK